MSILGALGSVASALIPSIVEKGKDFLFGNILKSAPVPVQDLASEIFRKDKMVIDDLRSELATCMGQSPRAMYAPLLSYGTLNKQHESNEIQPHLASSMKRRGRLSRYKEDLSGEAVFSRRRRSRR